MSGENLRVEDISGVTHVRRDTAGRVVAVSSMTSSGGAGKDFAMMFRAAQHDLAVKNGEIDGKIVVIDPAVEMKV